MAKLAGIGLVFSAFLIVAVLFLGGLWKPFWSLMQMDLSDPFQKSFASECLSALYGLQSRGLPLSFAQTTVDFHGGVPDEKNLKNNIERCFVKDQQSSFALESEVFTSEYEGAEGNILIVQSSIFDAKKNKIAEVNFHLDQASFVRK